VRVAARRRPSPTASSCSPPACRARSCSSQDGFLGRSGIRKEPRMH